MCKVVEELQQDEDLLRLGVEIIDDIDRSITLACGPGPQGERSVAVASWVGDILLGKISKLRVGIILC